MDKTKLVNQFNFSGPFQVRDEAWYREMLRQARMWATLELTLDCEPGETDRECMNRCKAQFIAAIDACLMHEVPAVPKLPVSPSTATKLEQCAKHIGTPMTLYLSASYTAFNTICPNCEEEKKYASGQVPMDSSQRQP